MEQKYFRDTSLDMNFVKLGSFETRSIIIVLDLFRRIRVWCQLEFNEISAFKRFSLFRNQI